MLKNILEILGTHWELFYKPCEHHVNFFGMWWEHFKNTKIQKIQFFLEIYVLTPSPRILQINLNLNLKTKTSYKG
jgi:hypothetical protein